MKQLLVVLLLAASALAQDKPAATAPSDNPAAKPAESPAPKPAGNPGDKPVEQTKKNIKVLTGMPTSQLIPVMAFMSNSLGVTCSFCHNTKAWESDELETKEAARQMVTMQRGINERYFEGQTVVTCNTCHQGHVRPGPVPSIANAGWAQPKPPETPKLPDVDAVLSRAPKPPATPAARVIRGTVERFNGRDEPKSGPFTVTEGGGQSRYETELSHPPEAGRMLRVLNLRPEDVRATRVVGTDRIRGREAYVVEVKPESGRRERWSYDATTGDLLRVNREMETPIGILPEQYDFDDYRTTGGRRMPYTLQWSRADYRVTYHITAVDAPDAK